MEKYHKIQTVFKRDKETGHKTIIPGDFSLPEFDYLKNNQWLWTEKVNGTNIRIPWDSSNMTFKGKTDTAQMHSPLLDELTHSFLPLITDFKNIFAENKACLYGEGYGAGVTKGSGKYKKNGYGFVLFDVKIGQWWLRRTDVTDIAIKLGIPIVPIIGIGTLSEMIGLVKKGFTSDWGDFIAEGLVATPMVEMRARNGDRIITKIKYADFSR